MRTSSFIFIFKIAVSRMLFSGLSAVEEVSVQPVVLSVWVRCNGMFMCVKTAGKAKRSRVGNPRSSVFHSSRDEV